MMTNDYYICIPRNEIEKTKNRLEEKLKLLLEISLDEGRRDKSRVTIYPSNLNSIFAFVRSLPFPF